MRKPGRQVKVQTAGLEAFIFDMDGVVTDTASVHAAAWKRLFDEFLATAGDGLQPFDPQRDYRLYVDGRNRYDGVRSFLESRGITLPEGNPSERPGVRTVCGLGNLKDRYFGERLKRFGTKSFDSTVKVINNLKEHGVKVAVVTASRNARAVLQSAGINDLFDVKVDGVDAAELDLPGKPDPAMFVEAARRLGVPPARAAVLEDALPGVQAAAAGGFGLVVGIDRTGNAAALKDSGASFVVGDLGEISLSWLRPG